MYQVDQLISLEMERHVLASLIKFPDLFPDLDGKLIEYDFVNETNRAIFCVIRSILSKGEKIDKVVVGQKIKNLGFKTKDNIDVFRYVQSVAESQINQEGGVEAAKELIKLRIRRELCETAEEVKQFVIKNGDGSIDHLISGSDKIYNNKINNYETDTEPVDLFDNLVENVEARAASEHNHSGLILPYKRFYELFGGFRPGNVYAFASRAGVGKSLLLNDLAYKTALLNNCKALILDTENLTEDMALRMAASITRIPFSFLDDGGYVKNDELKSLFESKKELFKKLKSQIYHKQVSGKPIESIVSMIRRWVYKYVGRGNPCLIIYDYIKLTGEKDYNKKEYELLGDKVNRLKELSVELNVPILTANQLNRSAESGTDDSSAISQTDRLLWFSSFVSIFRTKTLEEIAEDGVQFGTHKLIPLKTRFQGRDAKGAMDLVRIGAGKNARYVKNFISFNVENFNVEERGDLNSILAARAEQYNLNSQEDVKEISF